MSASVPMTPAIYQLPNEIAKTAQKHGLIIFNFGRAMVFPMGGYYRCPKRHFEFYSLSHLIKGKGKLWMPDIPERQVEPGHCIMMPPFKIHRYGAADDIYCEDHLCFCGPIADQMFNCGILHKGVINFGSVRRLLPIMEAASNPSIDSQFEANLRLQRLLLDLYHENRVISGNQGDMMKDLLIELKKDISHWWTVTEMSEFCQIGEDLLRKIFLQHTGLLPKQYLDRLRMRMATTMLIEKQQSIKDIAALLGYRDRFHFSRRFRAITGLSPQNYRKRFGKREAESAHISSELFLNENDEN